MSKQQFQSSVVGNTQQHQIKDGTTPQHYFEIIDYLKLDVN